MRNGKISVTSTRKKYLSVTSVPNILLLHRRGTNTKRSFNAAARLEQPPQGLIPAMLVARLITSPSPIPSSTINPGRRTCRARRAPCLGCSLACSSFNESSLRVPRESLGALIVRGKPRHEKRKLAADVNAYKVGVFNVRLAVAKDEDDVHNSSNAAEPRAP